MGIQSFDFADISNLLFYALFLRTGCSYEVENIGTLGNLHTKPIRLFSLRKFLI